MQLEAERLVESKLGKVGYRGLRVLCGADFFDAFTSHPLVVASWNRFNESSMQRDDLRNGFTYAGITFEEYRGGEGVTIEADEAWGFPEGVQGMFIERYAPADYMEAANTMGIDFYSKSEPMPFDKGITIETQSNPLVLNTRPNAVVRGGQNAAVVAAW